MSTFLYFTEEAKGPPKQEQLEEWGLGYAFERKPAAAELTSHSPSGGHGWLFADNERLKSAKFGFNADAQVWRKIPGSEVWVGYWKEHRPGPESLLRTEQLAGESVKLADGSEWQIPLLRFWADDGGFRTTLPARVDMNDEGQWVVGEAEEQAKQLDIIAERLEAGMLRSVEEGSKESPLTTEELLDISSDLLSVNYTVCRVEVAILGVLTNDQRLAKIARAAIDFDTAMEWASKKNEANSPQENVG